MSNRSQTLKLKALQNLGCQCSNCGSREKLQQHHIVPLAHGGYDCPTNITILCSDCHRLAHSPTSGVKKEGNTQVIDLGEKFRCFLIDRNDKNVTISHQFVMTYLHKVEKLSYKKIGEILNFSDTTVRKYIDSDPVPQTRDDSERFTFSRNG